MPMNFPSSLRLLMLPPGTIGQTLAAPGIHFGFIDERPDEPDFALNRCRPLHGYRERELAAQGIGPVGLLIASGVNEKRVYWSAVLMANE